MTTECLIHCIEEAAEFGDRFPDVSDQDVLDHVAYVQVLSAKLEIDWAISRCIIAAYNTAAAGFIKDEAVDTGIDVAKAWSLIPREYAYDHYA